MSERPSNGPSGYFVIDSRFFTTILFITTRIVRDGADAWIGSDSQRPGFTVLWSGSTSTPSARNGLIC